MALCLHEDHDEIRETEKQLNEQRKKRKKKRNLGILLELRLGHQYKATVFDDGRAGKSFVDPNGE